MSETGKTEARRADAARHESSARHESAARHESHAGDTEEVVEEIAIDPRIDKLIGQSLLDHYADIVAAPLPDAILVLLAQLEAKEKDA